MPLREHPRVLIIQPGPDFSVHDVHEGWLEALRELGCETQSYNLNDRLIFYANSMLPTGKYDEAGLQIVRNAMTEDQAILAATQNMSHPILWMWPDVVLFISGFFLTAPWFQMLRDRRIKTAILNTESPYQDEEQLVRGQLADLNLLNDPANLERFREATAAEYMPHAFRPSVHYPRTGPRDPAKASDLCFIGTAFKSRVEFFEQLAAGLNGTDILIGGSDWGSVGASSPLAKYVGSDQGEPDCVDNPQAAELYRHAKMGLNLYRRETEEHGSWHGWSMGPREVEMAAIGLPFLRDPRPEGDEVLRMLPTFTGPEDAAEQLRWWLAHDRERQLAADRARLAVQDRTFTANARRFLTILDGL
jgi:spore maturation protein CgeB